MEGREKRRKNVRKDEKKWKGKQNEKYGRLEIKERKEKGERRE